MSKKIILIIVAVVFVAGVFIGGAGVYLWKKQSQLPIEPKQTEQPELKQTESEKITYFNETYGYTLKIPKEWVGKYEIREEGNTITFFYIPVNDELKYDIFSITVYSKEEWEKELKEREESEKKGLPPGCCPIVFAETKGKVFVYDAFSRFNTPYDYPETSPEIVNEYQKMVGQVKEIIASFSLSK